MQPFLLNSQTLPDPSLTVFGCEIKNLRPPSDEPLTEESILWNTTVKIKLSFA